jgi:signal transduction histidine kinase
MDRQRVFVANAAHELRTPLTTILGVSLTLARHGRTLSDTELRQCVGAIERQGDRVKTLIDNLLDLAQLDSGRGAADVRRVDLADVVERAVRAVPPPVGFNIDTSLAHGEMAYADAERLEQVVVNLLVNSYRYGKAPVTISAERNNGSVLLTVADAGPGVPEDFAAQLFDPFTRVPGTGIPGSGLGLSIVKRLCESFGGSVRYSGRPGAGASFTVTVPASLTGPRELGLAAS